MKKFFKSTFTTINGDVNRNAVWGSILLVASLVHAFLYKDAVIFVAMITIAGANLGFSIKEDKVQ